MSDHPLFQPNDKVVNRSTRLEGVIKEPPRRVAGEWWYVVRFGGRDDRVVEEELESADEIAETMSQLAECGHWGRLRAFRCALAVERISHANRSTIYAFQSQRILFEPYQYKPLLKILDSPERRLLIADEVGLGKTIESGLVITELEARGDLDRILIICPSRLRHKWREELNRKFDQDFEIYDKQMFLKFIDRVRDNPRRHLLRAIVSLNTLRNQELRQRITTELGSIDVVIFDEAHHARNPETQTSQMLEEMCEIAGCVLLLTATPIHLSSRDLYTLMRAMRPAEYRDPNAFDEQLRRHAPVHDAVRCVRSQSIEALPLATRLLSQVFLEGVPEGRRNPVALQVIDDLANSIPANHREWIELERRTQELHLLWTAMTRTRKREVRQDAPTRRAKVYYCQWTPEEDRRYQELVGANAPKGWFRSTMGFGQIQRARQAASCLPAALAAQGETFGDDVADELSDLNPDDFPNGFMESSGALPKESLGVLTTDSKFNRLQELLREIWCEEPQAKVLIFTYFVGSSKYLQRRLKEGGVNAVRIAGDVPSKPNEPAFDERGKLLVQFAEDPSTLVMVSTEVGSEGLDFQFCHYLVNYDLPWNPMVVEQRIGRIDRFGQQSKVVNIFSLVVQGTVEDRVLARLYERIKIFNQSIGDLEQILGDTMRELQKEYVSGRLTEEEAERRVEQAERAIAQRRLHTDELEKNASVLFGLENYILDELNRVGRLGRFVSEAAQIAVIGAFLESCHPNVRLHEEEPGIWGLRLTEPLRDEILRQARTQFEQWHDRTKDGWLAFTTSGETAFRRKDLELVNANHPLIKLAVDRVRGQLSKPAARLGQARLVLPQGEEPELGRGLVYIAVYPQLIRGLRERRILDTIAWSQATESFLDSEAAERLLHLLLEQGEEWSSRTHAAPITPEISERFAEESTRRLSVLRRSEQRENAALSFRRRETIDAEYAHERSVKERRLRTVQEREHNPGVQRMMRAQLDKARTVYQDRLEKLEEAKQSSVTGEPEPLAMCAVEICRNN